jgi:hypothetical protein
MIVADDPSGPLIVTEITNSGTLRADGGTLRAIHSVDQTSTGRIEAINSSTVELNGVTITGGTLASSGSGMIQVIDSATLDSVTLVGNLHVGVGEIGLKGTFTNQGFLKLAPASSGPSTLLSTGGITTLTGGGIIQLASTNLTSAAIRPMGLGGSFINLDNTIRGFGNIFTSFDNRAMIVADDPSGPLIVTEITNSGTLRADGGTLRVIHSVDQTSTGRIEAINSSTVELNGVTITGGSFFATAEGRIHVTEESEVNGLIHIEDGTLAISAPLIAQDLTLAESAQFDLDSTLSLSGAFSLRSTAPSLWSLASGSDFQLTGGVGATFGQWQEWQPFEIGGHDYGIDPINHLGSPAGFVDNFSLPTLRIGSGAHVFLQDIFDNSVGTPDSLYVDTLIFDDPTAILNLNGLNLYYNTLSGSSSQIINSAVNVPEPGSTLAIMAGLGLLAARRFRRSG